MIQFTSHRPESGFEFSGLQFFLTLLLAVVCGSVLALALNWLIGVCVVGGVFIVQYVCLCKYIYNIILLLSTTVSQLWDVVKLRQDQGMSLNCITTRGHIVKLRSDQKYRKLRRDQCMPNNYITTRASCRTVLPPGYVVKTVFRQDYFIKLRPGHVV